MVCVRTLPFTLNAQVLIRLNWVKVSLVRQLLKHSPSQSDTQCIIVNCSGICLPLWTQNRINLTQKTFFTFCQSLAEESEKHAIPAKDPSAKRNKE